MPALDDGELLLKLRVAGFCGTDLFKLDTGSATPGTVLGHELVGDVVKVGRNVTMFVPGDRVAVAHHVACGNCLLCRRGNETMCETFRENLLDPGGFAEHLVVRSRAVQQCAYRLPETVSDDAAVFIEPAACVLRGVNRSGARDDATVAIIGGGSMGLLHLLVLRAELPKANVVVIDPLPERRTLALSLGASSVADPNAADETLHELTHGHGADAVFDTVGGAAVLSHAIRLSRQGGTVVLFAHAPAGQQANIDLNDLFKFERRVIGTYSGGVHEQRRIFELLITGRFQPAPLISHRMPLGAFDEGVRLARERRALKILFTPMTDSP